MKIYLGKFSSKYPEQVKHRFYAAGVEGNKWYGDVKVGDYVFVGYSGKIIELWQAREYGKFKNSINPKDDNVLLFDLVKKYDDISLINDFARYKYFKHDLNLVNKISKSVTGLGFIPINTSESCPMPEDIDFKAGLVDIYISLKELEVDYKEGDIIVTIDNETYMNIESINRFRDGQFVLYEELNKLYEEKCADDKKYSLSELRYFAEQDNAPKKRNYLDSLIEELHKNGFMKVFSIVSLYDNVLVGRKKTFVGKSKPKAGESVIEETVDDSDSDDEQYNLQASLLNFNPNLILYGPPGTGKTFATRKIIDNFEKKYNNNGGSYKQADKENRVKSVTFHQSYSYEEFIEGIRPELGVDSSNVGYKLENGLFKELCINAEKEFLKNINNVDYVDMIHSESKIWKMSLGERKSNTLFNECIRVNDIAIGWLNDQDLTDMDQQEILDALGDSSIFGDKPTQNANTIYSFVNEMTIGDIVLVYDSQQTTRMIGVIKSEYRYDQKYEVRHRRSVEWFKDLDYPINIHKYNGYKNLSLKTIYPLTRISISDIIEIVTQNSNSQASMEDKKVIKPYYMIIDEINRGNIAKIFGELITLVEQDKRGNYKSLLPYSKKDFTVPSNLYIIGTMNTADRSIAAIDTALRRRFTFVEIEPDSSILSLQGNAIINDKVDLAKLLDSLNERIINNYDRDHRIGHAYFMGIETLNNLFQTWYYKILPLLSEYFYNDIEALQSIVGKDFYDDNGNVKYLDISDDQQGGSEFEQSLINIYRV